MVSIITKNISFFFQRLVNIINNCNLYRWIMVISVQNVCPNRKWELIVLNILNRHEYTCIRWVTWCGMGILGLHFQSCLWTTNNKLFKDVYFQVCFRMVQRFRRRMDRTSKIKRLQNGQIWITKTHLRI